METQITVLCVNEKSIYKEMGLDCYDAQRDAYTFTGSNPVITHAPCQQWSRMKAFAKKNDYEKDLAWFCLEKVKQNGGIFEHPAYSSFFKEAGIKPTISVNQFWFGLEANKPTWLYFHGCSPIEFPLRFELPTHQIKTGFNGQNKIKNSLKWMDKKRHSYTTKQFALWLINSISQSIPLSVSNDYRKSGY